MTRVKELRFSLICPVNGVVSLGTELTSITAGRAHVACQACGGQHFIEPTEDTIDESDMEDALDEIETCLGELRSAADDAESAASTIQGQISDAESRISELRAALTRKAAA